MTTVVCIKVGTKYNADYVNKLASMVHDHTTIQHRFLCLTDNPSGVKCATVPIETSLPGWWAKLVLFKPHSALKGEAIVYLDLDTVIVDNIDFLFKWRNTICILKDWWSNTYNTSVMYIPNGVAHRIWARFQHDPTHYMNVHHGDQDWVTVHLSNPKVWQAEAPGKIGSYKANGLIDSPRDFALVCFHGEPKPHQIEKGWVRDNWI